MATEHARHRTDRHRSSNRRRGVAFWVALSVVAAVLVPASAASASTCFLFLCLGDTSSPTSSPAARIPGTPVAPVRQVNQSSNGGTDAKVGNVPSTTTIGVPNPGYVPFVGSVSAVADDGAYVLYESPVSSRVLDLMVYSPAVGGAVPVRVQVPPTWFSTPRATYPALYLLHGGNDKADYQSWSLYSRADEYLYSANALIVEPSLGQNAYATNYWNYGFGGSNQYDTFVSTELAQLLQRGYRSNGRAAVAGVSAGGYSALALAMMHPGEYGAAASFSGTPDTQLPIIAQLIEFGPITEIESPIAMWGDSLVNFLIWQNRNPAANLAKLQGVKLFVSSGNGNRGPLDTAGAALDYLEPSTLLSTQSFVSQAAQAGLPVTSDLYGNGEHTWPYWNRELHRAWPMLSSALGLS